MGPGAPPSGRLGVAGGRLPACRTLRWFRPIVGGLPSIEMRVAASQDRSNGHVRSSARSIRESRRRSADRGSGQEGRSTRGRSGIDRRPVYLVDRRLTSQPGDDGRSRAPEAGTVPTREWAASARRCGQALPEGDGSTQSPHGLLSGHAKAPRWGRGAWGSRRSRRGRAVPEALPSGTARRRVTSWLRALPDRRGCRRSRAR